MSAVKQLPSLCFAAAMLWCGTQTARADGAVAGAVALEPMKAATLPPGYHPKKTKHPIGAPDPPRAIVYLTRDGITYPVVPAKQAVEIAQHNYQFHPNIAALQTGGVATFPNHDDEFHSVFSYSSTKRFDLGRYRSDEKSPPVEFDKPGLVKIYCEIHKHMRALLLVLDTPWFTTTDTSGAFRIDHVPVGEYGISAFLASEKTLEGRVTVVDGATAHVDLGPVQ